MALQPHWLDEVIESAVETGDPKVVAQVIADSPRFLQAIQAGLNKKPAAGLIGPSYAQVVREEVRAAFAKT